MYIKPDIPFLVCVCVYAYIVKELRILTYTQDQTAVIYLISVIFILKMLDVIKEGYTFFKGT